MFLVELKDKQATIINFINIIKYVTVNEIKITEVVNSKQ